VAGGVQWQADTYSTGGKSWTGSATAIAGTNDDALYVDERSATANLGSFGYAIPVTRGGTFTVRLHFAELWFGAHAWAPAGAAGQRVFDVNLEGGAVELDNLDVFARAGSATALVASTDIAVTDGTLNLEFAASANQPTVAAIEVVYPEAPADPDPVDPPTSAIPPLRINAGGPAATSGGVDWAADTYSGGGKTWTGSATAIAGTEDDVLYRDERSATANLGQFSYAIPVQRAGEFTVRLHFAELWFGAHPWAPAGAAGQRVFDVNLEGGAVELDNLDIFARVGAATALVTTHTIAVTDGTLNIQFSASANQPTVSAIEVVYPAGSTTPTDPTGPADPDGIAWPASWASGPSAPQVSYETAVSTVNGTIYSFGGFDNQYRVRRGYYGFNPATGVWTNLGNMPAGLAETHQGATTDGRYIYLAGGFAGDLDDSRAPQQDTTSTIYRLDTLDNTWTRLPDLPAPRGAGAAKVVGNKLHYIGGLQADMHTNVADHWVLDLATLAWSTAAPQPNPKDHATVAAVDGKIYVMGGEHEHHRLHLQQKDAHVYDPATNVWTRLADMPTAKSHLEGGTFVSDGKIILAGGQVDNFAPTAEVVAYDPAADSWTTLDPLPAPRQGAIVQRAGNKVVVALGATETWLPQNTTWIGDLP